MGFVEWYAEVGRRWNFGKLSWPKLYAKYLQSRDFNIHPSCAGVGIIHQKICITLGVTLSHYWGSTENVLILFDTIIGLGSHRLWYHIFVR